MTLRVNPCILRTGGAAKEQRAQVFFAASHLVLAKGPSFLDFDASPEISDSRFSAGQSHDSKNCTVSVMVRLGALLSSSI